MRFSPRSKVGILRSVITILILVGALMVTNVEEALAASSSTIASYQGTRIASHVLGTNKNFMSTGPSTTASVQQKDPRYIPYRSPGNQHSSSSRSLAHGGALASGSKLSHAEGTLASNFDGLSDAQNKA